MSAEAEPTLDRRRQFVSAAGWTFASSMPDQPHEYTVRGKAIAGVGPPPLEEHDWFVREIRRHGYRARYGSIWYRYLEVDGFKYWVIRNVVNREHVAP